jgi:hypothetical protein
MTQRADDPIQAYINHIGRTLPRLDAVSTILADEHPTRYHIEGGALHLRMVLEAIALGSLAANRDAYAQGRAAFAKDWDATKILARLDRIHPRFYPAPQIPSASPDPSYGLVISGRHDGFLTRSDFPRAYGRLGELLHLENPFAPPGNQEGLVVELAALRESIWMLLYWHTITIVGDDTLYLIRMKDPSGAPTAMPMTKAGDLPQEHAEGADKPDVSAGG